MGLGKKIKRNNQKRIKKNVEKDMKDKMNMFDRLGDECLACKKEFDRKDRAMVESWNVVVRQEEKKVNLYCPECWTFAQKVIKEVLGEQGNTEGDVLVEEH